MANNFKDQADELKPREKVMAAGNAADCSLAELLAILLKTGAAGCDVMELSRRIITAFGSAEALVRSDYGDIRAKVEEYNAKHPDRKISGLGAVKMVELAAAFELARRGLHFAARENGKISDPDSAARIFLSVMRRGEECEHFWVLPLDARQQPLSRPLAVASGTVNGVNVHPRDVFRPAVQKNACSLIVAHNHPSGDPAPSRQDIELTRQLKEASKMIGIPLLDHLILTDSEKRYSFRENGRID